MEGSWVITFFCLYVFSKTYPEDITFVMSKKNQNYHTVPK